MKSAILRGSRVGNDAAAIGRRLLHGEASRPKHTKLPPTYCSMDALGSTEESSCLMILAGTPTVEGVVKGWGEDWLCQFLQIEQDTANRLLIGSFGR